MWLDARTIRTGYFTAFRHLAAEDLAFVFHYGDYIYEYGPDSPAVRAHIGDASVSTRDYRRRYAQYKSDPDLQSAHAAHAFFMTLDDHEVRNNWAGDVDDEEKAPPEVFRLRRQARSRRGTSICRCAGRNSRSGRPSALSRRAVRQSGRASISSIPGNSGPTSRATTATELLAPACGRPRARGQRRAGGVARPATSRAATRAGTSSPSR